MKLRDSFHPYAFVTVFFWSLGYVYTRMAMTYYTEYSLAFLRYVVASCTLLVIALVTRTRLPHKKDLGWFVLSGICNSFLYMICFNKGGKLVTASTSSIVLATVPILTAIIALVVYGEKLRGVQWLACAMEFGGILLLTLMGGDLSMNEGVLWMLGAACLLSTYNIVQRKLLRTYTALQASIFSMMLGTLMLSIFAPGAIPELRAAPPVFLYYVVILGIFCSGIAYVSWSKAFEKAEKTSSVSNYMFLTPFITSILSIVLANEIPNIGTVIGGSVILAGMFVFNFGGKKKAVASVPETTH